MDPSGHKSYPYEYFPNLFDDVPNPSTGPKPSDSTNLGKNIFEYVGIDVNTTGTGSHQKQHLIPQQVYVNSQFLQDIGFNIDSHWNGIFDKNMKMGSTTINDIFKANNVSKELTDRYVSDKTNHNGRHAKYNDAVEREVEKIQKKAEKLRDISYEQYVKYGQREIAILVEDLRTMNRDGINLYRCEDGKSNDPDEYYEEFQKKKQEAHEKNWHQKY